MHQTGQHRKPQHASYLGVPFVFALCVSIIIWIWSCDGIYFTLLFVALLISNSVALTKWNNNACGATVKNILGNNCYFLCEFWHWLLDVAMCTTWCLLYSFMFNASTLAFLLIPLLQTFTQSTIIPGPQQHPAFVRRCCTPPPRTASSMSLMGSTTRSRQPTQPRWTSRSSGSGLTEAGLPMKGPVEGLEPSARFKFKFYQRMMLPPWYC